MGRGNPRDVLVTQAVTVKHKKTQGCDHDDEAAKNEGEQHIALAVVSRIGGHAILQLETSFENGLRVRQFLS